MRTLSESDYLLYYELHFSLLLYVNRQRDILREKEYSTYQELQHGTSTEQKLKVRNALYKNISCIDEFIKENPSKFISEKLTIISSWKQFLRATFYVVRYLKDYAVFLDMKTPAHVYGVKALMSEFEEVIPIPLPAMVEAVLLPFRDCIIYDGLITPSMIIFGRGMMRDITDFYKEAEASFGVITTLSGQIVTRETKVEDLLKFYISSERNREEYDKEIGTLLDKHPALLTVYHQEMGRHAARLFTRRLHQAGVTNGYFAIFDRTIIAGSKIKSEAERIAKELVPEHKHSFVYYFALK